MSSLQQNSAPFSSSEIRQATGAFGAAEGDIVGVVTDSRAAQSGNLFVPLVGERFDGHDFVPQVLETGAFALSQRAWPLFPNASCEVESEAKPARIFQVADTLEALGSLARFHRARFSLPVIGITGSYGKTSTRALAFAALSAGFHTLSSQANFNNEIGVPLTLFKLDESHEAVVLEMGMRGLGQIEYLAQIAAPTIGIITNIGPQHIELLGSEENIALAKSELVTSLPANGLAILPADSPFIDFLRSRFGGATVLFGQSANAHFRVSNIETDEVGNIKFAISIHHNPLHTPQASHPRDSNFALESGPRLFEAETDFLQQENSLEKPEKSSQRFEISLPIPGAHNALNAAAAFAAAYCLGIVPDAIVAALQGATLPGARMRVWKLADQITVIDDCYNAGPDSMRAALATLLDFPGSGRQVAVLGAMKELGEFSETKHREVGAFAGSFCDLIIGVGGETRPLLDAALQSARQNERQILLHWCENAGEAASLTQSALYQNDILLVKGSRSVGLEAVVKALQDTFSSF